MATWVAHTSSGRLNGKHTEKITKLINCWQASLAWFVLAWWTIPHWPAA